MHTTTKIVAIVSLSFSLLGSVFATDWQYLGTNQSNDEVIAYDADSVRYADASSLAWVVLVNSDPKMPHDMVMSLLEVDCESFRTKFLTSRFYLRGKVLKTINSSDIRGAKWTYAAPGTLGETTVRAVCEKKRSVINLEDARPLEITKWGKTIIKISRKITNKPKDF